jgi:hypothetical protein
VDEVKEVAEEVGRGVGKEVGRDPAKAKAKAKAKAATLTEGEQPTSARTYGRFQSACAQLL